MTRSRNTPHKLTDKSKEQYGICLRGKPGWGENMAFVGPLVNAFGGQWFNMKWKPQLTIRAVEEARSASTSTMKNYGPPGATANGHNENRALFATGHCAHVDRCHVGGRLHLQPEAKPGRRQAGFAAAPIEVTQNGAGWFWAWSLGIPTSSKKADAAKSFVKWATSKDYIKLVGETRSAGSRRLPARASRPTTIPSTRRPRRSRSSSDDRSPTADPTKPTKDPVPYIGIQFVAIPEFQGIGTAVGQQIAAALAGQMTSTRRSRRRSARPSGR